jgi:hypothetical protein
VSLELLLRPPETAIVWPTLAEVEALLSGLPGPQLRATGPMELVSSEPDGEQTRVLLEGTAEGIEAIRVTAPMSEGTSVDARRPWAELARSLNWRLYDRRENRWLRPQEVLAPEPGWQGTLNAARPGLMALAACAVVLAVVLWNLGGRRQDAWLVVFAVGVAVYFSLRVWGLLTRAGRTRSRERL